MRAEIKSIEANDIFEWPNWQPGGAEDEVQWLTVTIGPAGEEGGDLFQVEVASPAGLEERWGKGKFLGLVVPVFTPEAIEQTLRSFVETIEGDTWDSLAAQLQPTMSWEFDAYRP